MNPARLLGLGVVIIFVGLFVVAVGASTGPGGSSSGGGFILIGPIPIVFGSGPDSGMLATVALVVSAVAIIAYLASFLLWRSKGGGGAEARKESE